jgi:hypothetical protein
VLRSSFRPPLTAEHIQDYTSNASYSNPPSYRLLAPNTLTGRM